MHFRAVKVSKKIRKTDLKKIRESLNYTGMMREWEDWGWFGGTGWLAGWLGLDEWLVGPRNLYTINQCCCTTGELLSEFPESHTATEARNSLKLFWGPGQPRLSSSKHGFTRKFLLYVQEVVTLQTKYSNIFTSENYVFFNYYNILDRIFFIKRAK